MAKYFRLERQEDIDFLIRMFDRAINKIKNNIASFDLDQAESITRIHDALHSSAETKDASILGVPEEAVEQDKAHVKKPVAKKPKASAKLKYNLCVTHPYYGAVRAPQQDCDGCWGAYKSMNPNSFAKKRKDFERKANKQSA